MITFMLFLIYNLLIYPCFFLLLHIAALFNNKIRRGVMGRYQNGANLRAFLAKRGKNQTILLHCASMGEFEHIKPLIEKLKLQFPDHAVVVTFFSPSGIENVRTFPGVDLFLYQPFDWWLPVLRFYRQVKPEVLIIARYDAWPNQVWIAALRRIPMVLANASMSSEAGRLNPLARWFQGAIYSRFSSILCISEADAENYRKISRPDTVRVVGDTKFDQALIRATGAKIRDILPASLLENHRFLVGGSTWPQDEQHLLPACIAAVKNHDDLLCILCPHEPTEAHLSGIEQVLRDGGQTSIRLSAIEKIADERFLLVDRIGILASLYAAAAIAYVGGSFYQNVHNVLEPAAYGIPVLLGPVNKNSREAQQLKQAKAIFEVTDGRELQAKIEQFLQTTEAGKKAGQAALAVISQHKGATDRTIQRISALVNKQENG